MAKSMWKAKKGVGSTFAVTVTLKASSRSAVAEHGISLPDLRAIVVDDDEISCEHAQTVLRVAGIEAESLTDPAMALHRIREAYEQNCPYQLLLTDYKMPDMNGLDLTRAVRAFDEGKTAVLLLTGYNWEIIEEEAASVGVDAIMAKPLFSDTLIQRIHHMLLEKRGDASIADETSNEETSENALAGRNVLMAEDVDQNAEILADLLELEDITSERAENGERAVAIFSEKPVGYFDAILMDVRMPVMDGLAATRAIRALDRTDAKTIPIIAMTANVFDEDVERSLQAGMNAHLFKPIEPERLYETMARLIEEREKE